MKKVALIKKNWLLYVCSILGGIVLTHSSYWIINNYFSENDFSNEISFTYNNYPEELLIFLALFIAPFLETFVFQSLILKVPILWGMKFNNRNLLILFILSLVLFCCNHIYNLPYIIYSFIAGVYLNCIYIYADYFRSPSTSGFLLVSIIHFFINLSFCF
ncbi:CPBP family intramembrane metalloprotease [Dysgonomonas capnocytophagoides]|uniref:CPBP family intramembrane metalloprotease n=1 Tax=Dysgonomonas capnocytophagoides TaxID=45254 RepID=A0A4Y8L8L0_9BACT|nr:CPBP family intramembrane metalloprotease [Dysgonomonas capnocytophagoides]